MGLGKPRLTWNLIWQRDKKDKKKGLCEYINSEGNAKENLAPVLHREEELLTKSMEKSKVLGALFSSLLSGKTSLWES